MSATEDKPPVTPVPSRAGAAAGSAGTAVADSPPRTVRAPRRAPRITTLQLKRIDPWTTLKVSLIVSIVMFFVWMIAIGLLYALFSSLNVISRINDGWATVTRADAVAAADPLITPGLVFGVAAVIGAINIVVFTALSTVSAVVYNAASGMAGGVELTLGERE